MESEWEWRVELTPIDTLHRGPTAVEERADQLLRLLPTATVRRTRDVFELTCDEADGLVLVLTPEALEIRLRRTEWTKGTHGPALSSGLWKRVSVDSLTEDDVRTLLDEGRNAWQASLRTCSDCGDLFPADHFLDDMAVCHGCGQANHGVVY